MADRKALSPQAGSEAWNKLPWRKLERHVYRIQKRIYRASQHGNERAVHKLQKLLLKSEAAQLLAVRRVTQDNQGKRTAGIDGVKSVEPAQRFIMVKRLHLKHWKLAKPKPVRRVWIPKPGKKEQRPLGIPVMYDRAKQALVKLALEPQWEARFEPNSYGFRPGRSAHDAIAAIFLAIRYKSKFVYDGDIKGCFDNINQEALLGKLHTYPVMRHTIKGWLKAGVVDKWVFTETTTGTPQGGVISPLLANIALHGMEEAALGGKRNEDMEQPYLIRYADDFVIVHSDRDILEQAAKRVTDRLMDMGLAINPKKTRITHTLTPYEGNVGFNFLGFTVRQFRMSKKHSGKDTRGKPLGFATIIKPSKDAIKTHMWKTNRKMKELRAAKQEDLIGALNPIIQGWCNYYKRVVASETFSDCDYNMYWQLSSWQKRRHHGKSREWMQGKYWYREDDKRWVFAAPKEDQQGKTYLYKLRQHSQTHIQRHVKVRGTASPYDGNLIYWAQRLKDHPLMRYEEAKLLQIQKGMCPRCGLYFRDGDHLEVDHVLPTEMGGKDILGNKMVYHSHCHHAKTAEDLVHIREYKAGLMPITEAIH